MIVLLSLTEARKPGMNRLWGRGRAGSLIWWKAFFFVLFVLFFLCVCVGVFGFAVTPSPRTNAGMWGLAKSLERGGL